MNNVYLLSKVDIEQIWPLAGIWTSLGGMISYFLPKVFIFAGIILFIMIIGAGFMVISSAGKGDAHSSERAKNFLTYSLIGFGLIFGAFWIMQIINKITGGSLGGAIQ